MRLIDRVEELIRSLPLYSNCLIKQEYSNKLGVYSDNIDLWIVVVESSVRTYIGISRVAYNEKLQRNGHFSTLLKLLYKEACQNIIIESVFSDEMTNFCNKYSFEKSDNFGVINYKVKF